MPRKKFDLSQLPEAPNLHFEQGLWLAGVAHIGGIDEAGRGALAGPVSAGVVILPNRPDLLETLHGVRDSKQMTHKARVVWAEVIRDTAVCAEVGFAQADEIDEIGIVPATRLAAMRAIAQLSPPPAHLLVDAIKIPGAGLPETTLIKGDRRSLSIAAASILAKVARDLLMEELDAEYPGYGFAHNKGYGTSMHRAAIETLGPCKIHRYSFAPIRQEEDPQLPLI